MTAKEKLEQLAKDHFESLFTDGFAVNEFGVTKSFIAGGLKGMEIQKEIDAPKFKELVWDGDLAKTPFGYYSINKSYTHYKVYSPNGVYIDSVESRYLAEQLAQKDYEEKCKSLLK